ncbi:hypothetical protein ZHAS_00006806 [Anopheles sinensis]|uniref:Uncharacterized protein n=1 Tax=Anopheles sinensis TaxID=74873 RepID=A0A084VN36_ANOSI|nr:hypothetical protein ZHAS_00006806 [Anopheles sinensis]
MSIGVCTSIPPPAPGSSTVSAPRCCSTLCSLKDQSRKTNCKLRSTLASEAAAFAVPAHLRLGLSGLYETL